MQECRETSWRTDWGDSSSFSGATTLSAEPRYQSCSFRTTVSMTLSDPVNDQTRISSNSLDRRSHCWVRVRVLDKGSDHSCVPEP